jgi:hypothetical protein
MKELNIFIIIIFIILFYLYGILLSKLIDYIFPDINTKHDYIIIIETIFEILVSYIIFFLIKNHVFKIIKTLFIKMDFEYPSFMDIIFLLVFSSGLFNYLSKYSKKIDYLYNKYSKL